jgi:glycosyltransferase involved in cell wall biosynthesis
MKVTFVIPPLNLAGGTRVIAIYAERLQRRGHSVTVVCPSPGRQSGWRGRFKLPSTPSRPASHFDGTAVDVRMLSRSGPVLEADVPMADCVIATWWETAEWVNRFSMAAGAKVYFVQGHEVFSFLPPLRTRATYRMPFRKIVIARWLADVMRDEYDDADVDLVPNAVDHTQFFAPPRGKQPSPTVGLLYSPIDLKRFGVALAALTNLRAQIPGLHVRAFGIEYPPTPLPGFVAFSHRPPQDALRGIYASCDVWLTASSSEGFNLPAMEAMACRTPVVATRTGWPAEAVLDGVNGACVDIDDVQALERETGRILGMPDADWQLMSARAYETVRNSSWERSADLFERALESAVARSRAG